ncbi:MAG: peptidylprolyl isomerase [Ignavibacteriota bacterium]
MNCEKHLNKTSTKIFFLAGVLAIAACSKEQKKDDFIARVNDSYLTREDFASLADTSNFNSAQKEQLIKKWIYQEVLFQEAAKEGITKDKDYLNIIKKSSYELAVAMLIERYESSEEINYSDDDLINYYESDKNYFRLNSDSYQLNKVSFSSEDKAIKFRRLALDSDWKKALSVFVSDSSLIKNAESVFVEENNIYPAQLSRIIKDFYPDEISIVIAEKPGYYSIVQLLNKYNKQSIPPFEIIKSKVEKRFTAEKKNLLVEEYLKDLYSQNEIEIKK